MENSDKRRLSIIVIRVLQFNVLQFIISFPTHLNNIYYISLDIGNKFNSQYAKNKYLKNELYSKTNDTPD